MKLWAIADPHLGLGLNKTMGKFGKNWLNHPQYMAEQWKHLIREEDSVIVAGDISWAMTEKEVIPDLHFLASLPGTKYLGRGNHDYWWNSNAKIEKLLDRENISNIKLLRTNAHRIEMEKPVVIFGTRAWLLPSHLEWKEADQKYYKREQIRLALALKEAKKLYQEGDELVAVLHYPALGSKGETSEFSEIIASSGAKLCIYGHVHGMKGKKIQKQSSAGVLYCNTACDVLDFTPIDVESLFSITDEKLAVSDESCLASTEECSVSDENCSVTTEEKKMYASKRTDLININNLD